MSVHPVGTTVVNFADDSGLGRGVGVGARDGSLLPPHAAADISSNNVSAMRGRVLVLFTSIELNSLQSGDSGELSEDRPPGAPDPRGSCPRTIGLMATRSAPAVCHLRGRDAAQLDALLQQDPVGNAYLRS